MTYSFVIVILLVSCLGQSFGLNVLFISSGAAGHVTPLFELSKTMNNHNITFLTQQLAQSFIDLKSYSSPSFHVVYDNNSPDALVEETNREQQLISFYGNSSLIDALSYVATISSETYISLLHKTIHILTTDKFDVIIAEGMIVGVSVLCEKTNTPCVLQYSASSPDIFDLNLPNFFSLLSSEDMTQIKYRIYNVAFTIRLLTKIVSEAAPEIYTFFQSLPRIPGPFYGIFTLKNLFSSKSKCLNLVSIPLSFFPSSYSHHHTKYLGPFITETLVENVNNDLTTWIKSKPFSSIVYGAFGSSSLIQYSRMTHLITGLANFLLQVNGSSLLLAFRTVNYLTYQTVLKDLNNNELRDVLNDHRRVRIENGFVNQKWILQQKSIKVFLSHCGMGSALEGLFFARTILCMPFSLDQFANAIAIRNLNLGQSLFTPPSLWKSFIRPYDFSDYTFTAYNVTTQLLALTNDRTFEKAVNLMSIEIKHAGGLKRAVEEIEFFVNIYPNFDRFKPFQSTLFFYQRYMLDLLFVFVVLPGMIIIYLTIKCCKQRRKQKTD
jgi:hypothetical protein